jgi:hypothetical protein
MIDKAWVPRSERDKLEIRDELERILASAPFGSSRRYPALLRYVVEKTLSDEVEDLKERTLGVEVFHRTPDYDTNADPVVRFSAGEVRRRLAQFYQDNGDQKKLIKINLPLGSYVPQFFRLDEQEQGSHSPADTFTAPDPLDRVAHKEMDSAHTGASSENVSIAASSSTRKSFLYGLLVGVIAIAALASIGWALLRQRARNTEGAPISQVWTPLLTSPDAVIISVGRTRVDTDNPEPPDVTIEQHILRPNARISLAAVQAVSQVAGFLQAQHKQFSIHEAYSTTLQDLHRRPATLVSGYNNVWTMRLLQPLRFHFEQTGSLHYIVDAQHPERRDWSVNFDMPYLQETADYAIIGRFYDPTSNGPVVVVAGIGSNGSQAAGEFIVSPDALESLARIAPNNSLNENFEAVLKVEVIAGNTGAATVVASEFWR